MCNIKGEHVSEALPLCSHHEVQVEILSTVSKVPETVKVLSTENHREVVLVGAPEQLLVRHVGVGVRQRSTVDQTPQQKDRKVAGTL